MRSLTLFSLLFLVAGPAAAKDLALHQHVTPIGLRGEAYDAAEYMTPSLRITDGPHGRTVIDAKSRTVTVLDKDAKTFWEVSFESLRRQTKLQDEMPDQARRPRVGAPVTLAPTGATETIAGHPAAENLLEGGSPAGSVWIAKDLESPADSALWKDWPGLGNRIGLLGKVMDAVGTKGVPLRSIVRIGGSTAAGITIEVTSVGEESPAPALSAVPEGYTRASRHSLER